MKLSQYSSVIQKNINIHIPQLFTGPLLLHVDITNRCNLRCMHCDVWKFKVKKDLNYQVFTKCIDDSHRLGLRFIAISGGEPLLHKDIFKFIYYLKKKGIYINVSTNGILLNNSIISFFKKVKLDSITVSMESINKKYDLLRGTKSNFPKLLKNVRELIRNKMDLHVGICITDKNFMDLPDILEFLKKEGIEKIYFYPFYFSPRNVNKNHSLYKKMHKNGKVFTDAEVETYRNVVQLIIKKYAIDFISKRILQKSISYFNGEEVPLIELPCYAPLFSAVIGFDGEVSPCWYSTKALGNIHTDSFEKIWYSKDFVKIREYIRNKKCYLTNKNCLITHRIISARLDLLYILKIYLSTFLR